ncbi:purine-nucleoside phosphorylase [Oceanithermus sp.]
MSIAAIEKAVAAVRRITDFSPEVGIVLGSGLGPLAGEIEVVAEIPYADIPGFPVSTAPGHEGKLIFGRLAGRPVLAYKGRVHYYEGYPMSEVIFPVRVGYFLGAKRFVVTSAAGGLNPNFAAGDFMLHLDFINAMGTNPLIGPNDERLGPRFPVTFDAYDPEYLEVARRVARAQDVRLREGVYLAISGPSYASRSELRVYRYGMYADAIGMSTVPEVIALRHLGARVLGLSTITDMALADSSHHANEQEVIRMAEERGPVFRRLVAGIVAELP